MKPVQIVNLSLAVALLILSFIEVSEAQTKKAPPSQGIIADSQRRQALNRSGTQWFERNVLPIFRGSLSRVDGYGVSVIEPRVTLPPSLGGPLKMTEVMLEAKVTGWNTGSHYHRYRDYYSRYPDSGSVECRYRQKLWAAIDSQGRPVKIMDNQRATTLIACFTGGHIVPGYHGKEESYWPNY